MTSNTTEKRNPNDYTTVTVNRSIHDEIKKYFEEEGNGFHIGKFYDNAARDRLKTIKDKNSLWNRFNSQTLISNGFSKIGNTSYKRGEDVVTYTGTHWYYNDILMDESNYESLIFDRTKAKFNPTIPNK